MSTDIMAPNFELPTASPHPAQHTHTMPPVAMDDYSRPVTPDHGAALNGMGSPRTPKGTGLSLTEYTANPSPPSEDRKSRAQSAIPEAFLLPNGYPDVRRPVQSPSAERGRVADEF
jgi:hypothetical protein